MTKPQTAARNAGIDALRAALTLLVVFHHTAIAYGGSGSWFYQDVRPSDAPSSLILTIFCALNQAYFMGLFFLIAGSMTPGAIARHGPLGFLRERLLRLGLPLLVFAVVLGPLTVALAQTAKGAPVLETLGRLLRHGALTPGPMWFVEALLIFSCGYVALRAVVGAPRLEVARPFPSNQTLALAALATGAAAFGLRLVWPVGQTVLALQLGFFASYVLLFLAGCLGAKGRWLENIPRAQMALWSKIALFAGVALPAILLLLKSAGANPDEAVGGVNMPAIFYAFWEPLFAWGAILGLLYVFQRRFATLGPFWSRLVRRAYLIFIIHPPVLVAVTLALRGLPAPILIKFALAGGAACALCFLIAGALLRIPAVSRVV